MKNIQEVNKPTNKKSLVSTLEALLSILVLASGTIYAFVILSHQNGSYTVIAGVLLVAFCVKAVIAKIFNK
jgi:hypothetical protein